MYRYNIVYQTADGTLHSTLFDAPINNCVVLDSIVQQLCWQHQERVLPTMIEVTHGKPSD